jgi:ADP-ribosylglycohydrolase
MTDTATLSAAEGCLLGSAIGDALGAPTEFLRWQAIRAAYGPEGIRDFDAKPYGLGAYTDDTQLAIAVARGILSSRNPGSVGDTMPPIARWFARWYATQSEPGQSRAPGGACMRASGRLHRGSHWCESAASTTTTGPCGTCGLAQFEHGRGRPIDTDAPICGSYSGTEAPRQAKGNGAVMRAHPVALAYRADRHLMEEIARLQATITHDHPLAAEAAAWWVHLVADVIDSGGEPGVRIGLLEQVDGELRDWLETAVAFAEEVRDGTLTAREALNQLGRGCWVAEEAVAAALLLWLACDDYTEAVCTAANMDGDSDTVAAMAGALWGAAHPEQIPPRWITLIEGRYELLALAAGLQRYGEELAAANDF